MTSGGDGHLLVEREGHVMVVTMNRPERRNALSPEMMRGMAQAWDEANADPDVRAVLLTGAGGAFCAGADLREMSDSAPGDAFAAASDRDGNGDRDGDGTSTAVSTTAVSTTAGNGNDVTVDDVAAGVIKPLLKGFLLDKPLIAAVEGPAIAGGTEILQATDIRIAGESARFGVPEVCRGIYP
ncbi:MAG: enoyl-CoA hydratase-related protein, partial [Acidimicrobiales bacterium]|nr:enoyl-CoA hydratase-related protein [Acidimicrobiales bacterium]